MNAHSVPSLEVMKTNSSIWLFALFVIRLGYLVQALKLEQDVKATKDKDEGGSRHGKGVRNIVICLC
jgi:hypothetical protein